MDKRLDDEESSRAQDIDKVVRLLKKLAHLGPTVDRLLGELAVPVGAVGRAFWRASSSPIKPTDSRTSFGPALPRSNSVPFGPKATSQLSIAMPRIERKTAGQLTCS
jgi:hypothetical protein